MKIHSTISALIGGLAAIMMVSCATTSTAPSKADGVIPYASDKCAVTGNRLGSMGDPVTIVHQGHEVKFCCKPCVDKFRANPDRYLSSL